MLTALRFKHNYTTPKNIFLLAWLKQVMLKTNLEDFRCLNVFIFKKATIVEVSVHTAMNSIHVS